ncbi:MAG: transposase, partial [Ruminococcus sp.]|nr:transposase [Ruminococcus sp.]
KVLILAITVFAIIMISYKRINIEILKKSKSLIYNINKQYIDFFKGKFYGLKIDYHCIMPNHLHFVIRKEGAHMGAPLHEIIKWYKTQTTNQYIRMVKESVLPPFDKHIWQRNYFEHVIRGEKDLYEIRKYIDNNPAKWFFDEYYSKKD